VVTQRVWHSCVLPVRNSPYLCSSDHFRGAELDLHFSDALGRDAATEHGVGRLGAGRDVDDGRAAVRDVGGAGEGGGLWSGSEERSLLTSIFWLTSWGQLGPGNPQLTFSFSTLACTG
jgi:hypothetical protein